ncbi:MAG: T9SS type A sorting domain-containing protein [Candidatus Neomarinimicrobiota bacterium]
MKRGVITVLLIAVVCQLPARITGDLRIAAVRVSFHEDNSPGTTGTGQFLYAVEYDTCANYTIDPAPHDKNYFRSQIYAVDNYFRSVSYDQFGIDTANSRIFPAGLQDSYQLADSMSHYHRYGEDDLYERRVTELFRAALELAWTTDTIDFSDYDLVVVFHAGIGQDFSLPFLDPTPEDLPSTYVDPQMISNHLGVSSLVIGGRSIDHGLVLPETQNHLLYSIGEDMFAGASDPCDYQYGLTGTFAMLLGFAVGLPPLWDIESGRSGIGIFGLMDQGSNNGRGLIPAPPDAWTRIRAGWEEPMVAIPGNLIQIPERGQDNTIKVDIDDDEYFLVENRTNWFRDQVSIDSLRWLIYQQGRAIHPDSGRYPAMVEILFDSVAITRADNGVVTAVPDYDLGLPASGLLIWHIDEQVINSTIGSYSINADNSRYGVDLEEADGAQDIGFQSIFPFADPSGGYFGDIWYQGNPERDRLYPGRKGQPLEFGPYTYPDTRSNAGAATFLNFQGIGRPADTMSFFLSNDLIADGFPDLKLDLLLLEDLDGDAVPDLVGSGDSLWWAPAGTLEKRVFHALQSSDFRITVTDYSAGLKALAVAEITADSVRIVDFRYNSTTASLETVWTGSAGLNSIDRFFGSRIDNSITIVSGLRQVKCSAAGCEELILDSEPLDTISVHYQNSSAIQALKIFYDGQNLEVRNSDNLPVSSLSRTGLRTLAAADIDGDGQVDIITASTTGELAVYDQNCVLKAGFPVAADASGPVLIRDLYGDACPELMLQNTPGEICIYNNQGQRDYRLANAVDNNLLMAGDFRRRSSIISRTTVWSFDSVAVAEVNEWAGPNGGAVNDRLVYIATPLVIPTADKLIETAKTYAYPNPARNGYTTIRIAVGTAEKIEISIFDLAGYHVRDMKIDQPIQQAVNEIRWDVGDIESGVYFVRVRGRSDSQTATTILKVGVIH